MQCIAIERVVAYLRIPPMLLACPWTLAPGCAFASRRCSLRPFSVGPCRNRRARSALKALNPARRAVRRHAAASEPSAKLEPRGAGEYLRRGAAVERCPTSQTRNAQGSVHARHRCPTPEVRGRGPQPSVRPSSQLRPCPLRQLSSILVRMNTKVSCSLSCKECAANARPNQSVERTSNGGAHWRAPSRAVAPLAAAHLKR